MISGEAIVAAARTYLDTPFHHQGRVKGVGIDCIGLAICVARDVGLVPPDFNISGYARLPNGQQLQMGLAGHLDRVEVGERQTGDILLMRFRTEPQHVAIVTDVGIIHAYADAKKVVEHRLDELWLSRTVSAYRFGGSV